MNYLQLRARVSQRLGLASSGADSTEEYTAIGDTVNEGIVDILARTRLRVKCINITLTAGTQEYELDQAILRLYNIYHGAVELVEVAPGDIKQLSDGSNAFAMVGFNRIALAWVPTTSDTTISAWYSPRPTAMTVDSQDPSALTFGGIPTEFHDAIVNYSCWQMGMISGDKESGAGERFRILYEGKDGMAGPGTNLGKIKKQINRRVANGSRQARHAREYDRLTGNAMPDFWTG